MAYTPSYAKKGGGSYTPSYAKKIMRKQGGLPGTAAQRAFVKKNSGRNIFENFGSDVQSMVLGTPGAVKGIASAAGSDVERFTAKKLGLEKQLRRTWHRDYKPPKSYKLDDIAKAVAKDYAYRWGPLFRADPGKFWARFEEHPASDLLDIIALLSAGTGAAAKVGAIGKAPARVAFRSPGGIAKGLNVADDPAAYIRPIHGSELSRRMKSGIVTAKKRLPGGVGEYYESMRHGRYTQIQNLKGYTHDKLKLNKREAVKRKMSVEELTASHLRLQFPIRSDLERYKSSLIGVKTADASRNLLNDPKVAGFLDSPSEKMLKYEAETGKVVDYHETFFPDDASLTLEQRRYLPTLIARGAKYVKGELRGPKPIPEMIADIKRDLDAAGLPEPTYLPHASVDPTGGGLGTGGVGISRDPRFAKNRAVLMSMGRVAFDLDTLTPRYMRTIRWASYVDRHGELIASGIKIHRDALPADFRKNYVLVRQHLGERLGYTKQTAAEFNDRLAQHFDASDELDLAAGVTHENELTTLNPEDAFVDEAGNVVIIRKAYAKRIVGEYRKESTALKWLWDKPTDVWRAIVLNLRVGWLVNNIVGNSFLYILKNSGPDGMAAYGRALRGERYEGGKVLSPDQMADLLPEQTQVFSNTQMPTGRAGRFTTSDKNPVHWLRRADRYTEQSARRAYATRLAARSPEVRVAVKSMRGQSRKWNQVAEDVLRANPKLAERISEEVNAGLGDYFSMTEFERRAIRRVAPFYAWYKAITRITLMLPVDYPARALILANLGKIGSEMEADTTEGLPPWLAGSVGLPGGYTLSTQAMNPMGTVTSIGRGFSAGDWYSQQQRLGLLNPFVAAFWDAHSRQGPYPYSLLKELGQQGRNLPPARLAFPPHRKSYEGSDFYRELFSYLGVPVKKPVR